MKQNREDAQTYVEYGLTNELTIFGQTALERYALSPPTQNVYTGLDYSDIGLRAKLWSTGEWVFSGEATAFIPGAKDGAEPAQAGDTGGAGEARLLAGTNFVVGSMPAFFDGQFGYRLRTGGPPDEWHADLTLGLKPAPGVLVMIQDYTTVSGASTNAEFPAWRTSVVEASLVLPLDARWSVQLGLFMSVWAVKTNTQRGVALSVWRTSSRCAAGRPPCDPRHSQILQCVRGIRCSSFWGGRYQSISTNLIKWRGSWQTTSISRNDYPAAQFLRPGRTRGGDTACSGPEITIPPSFLMWPAQMESWNNYIYGDCVTAEEAFAKATSVAADLYSLRRRWSPGRRRTAISMARRLAAVTDDDADERLPVQR